MASAAHRQIILLSAAETAAARQLSRIGRVHKLTVAAVRNVRCGMKICPAWSAVRKTSNIDIDGSDKCCNWFS